MLSARYIENTHEFVLLGEPCSTRTQLGYTMWPRSPTMGVAGQLTSAYTVVMHVDRLHFTHDLKMPVFCLSIALILYTISNKQ